MQKISYQPFGAQFVLTLTGDTPANLAQTVNTFCNHGMFFAPPDEYDEAKHTKVILAATQARVHGALQSIAEARLIAAQGKLPRAQRLTGDAFTLQADKDALALWEQFVREDLQTLADENRGRLDDLRDYESQDVTPEIRERGRRLLREFKGRALRADATTNRQPSGSQNGDRY